ncbi:B12-binding domain-containing radical SAM protein [Polaromonas naphthalenivorans]|uniref:Radical SAM domain protein n=1 Tax=Polaromonas naphthalenivorans (strain CJ2) TaxID=365044 RepID=A1VJ82_POLNA|nr:B12-binding domain-containing radical SAM protein [Polaromonas naphthalenivorans]ABM35710.1 Radical SAM domain protein [Polaromonas naphthalenivorans CJ2]
MPSPQAPDSTFSPAIVLATLNAKYIHAALGLRCLLANLDRHGGAGLRAVTQLREFTIGQRPVQIVESLLALSPKVIGLGVYIWNVVETTQVVRLLKTLRPDIKIVLGGPEVSFETGEQEICRLADHVVTGWGDVSFPKLCRALLDGPQPLMKIIAGEQPPLDALALPYGEYTDEDLAKRLLYVEASRGCPFKCEFCLSSLDKTAWAFELDRFMAEMALLYRRGARNFKFVDRTFNLKVDFSVRILQFFLDRMKDEAGAVQAAPGLFVHFEVVPDSLHERLKALIAQFPAGSLQFEVGIQSFNPEVQQRISRKQDNAKTAENLRWLVTQSQAHVHADLIFGLPGETLQSFAEGFDRLHELAPHEIQFGILKRLRGTPITRHTLDFAMAYDPQTPYTILQTSTIDFATMQRIQRFARYWEMVANSGRFSAALRLLLRDGPEVAGSAFHHFLDFSDWLWRTTAKTHEFALEKLVDVLFEHLTAVRGLNDDAVRAALLADYRASGARGRPQCLADLLAAGRADLPAGAAKPRSERQGRHVSQQTHRDAIQQAAAAA